MQKKCLLVVASFVLVCTACFQNTNPSGKVWFYTHSTGTIDVGDPNLTPACFINLQNDGSYTRDFGSFDYGNWTYNDKQIVFTSFNKKILILPVDYLTTNEMQTGPEKGPFNNFESQHSSFSSRAGNPFSKENNEWRIPATAKETDQQIRTRLLNHLRFWELYFTWASDNNIQYIDVRSTPTLIKIYGNGFGLKPFQELPAAWKSYFFDEEDCRKANTQIKYLFDNNAIAWPHTENKYKMFISAFQQLQQKLP